MKKLLVAEDNAIVREGLAVILRREGYDVALAANGQEALDYLRDNPAPDLVLLDMLMPVVDGWQLLTRLHEMRPPPRVLVVSGTDAVGREWALAHGCAGSLRKPIEAEALLAEIGRCLA